GGRQRPRGGLGRDPGGAAGVRRGRARLGPDPRAEREHGPRPAPARRRGLRLPVGRTSRRGPSVTSLEPLAQSALALSRSTVDRVTDRRADAEWLDAAWADPASRVLVVEAGQALVREHEDRM